jgi:hypothetical protein
MVAITLRRNRRSGAGSLGGSLTRGSKPFHHAGAEKEHEGAGKGGGGDQPPVGVEVGVSNVLWADSHGRRSDGDAGDAALDRSAMTLYTLSVADVTSRSGQRSVGRVI